MLSGSDTHTTDTCMVMHIFAYLDHIFAYLDHFGRHIMLYLVYSQWYVLISGTPWPVGPFLFVHRPT